MTTTVGSHTASAQTSEHATEKNSKQPAPDGGRPAEAPRSARLWALGAGKGGVGKSVVTANLGVALAARGRRVALVDADLGGANLHTFLGLTSPPRTIADYVGRTVDSLEDVLVPTGIPNLTLASGARARLDAANLHYAQKERLLRAIRSLPADHVLLDLGAGTSFNVLDFFVPARHRLVVLTPEPTAIENAYHFLKAAFFRMLRRSPHGKRLHAVTSTVLAAIPGGAVRSPRELVRRVTEHDPELGLRLAAAAWAFTPTLLLNRVEDVEQRRLGEDLEMVCRDYFGGDIRLAGLLEEDERVRRSVLARRPAVELYPGSPFVRGIEELAARLDDEEIFDADRGEPRPEDWEVLGVQPGTPTAQVAAAYRRRRSVYSQGALASYMLLEDDERKALLARLDEAWARVSSAAPSVTATLREAPLATAEVLPEAGQMPDPEQRPGAYLRAQRRLRGISLEAVSAETKIRPSLLRCIEEDRVEELPAPVFVRGFVVQIARMLGLGEPERLAELYLRRLGRTT